jgi:hypothetical protein
MPDVMCEKNHSKQTAYWHTQHDVSNHLVVRHLNMTDGDTKAKHLLELELDC